MKKVMIIALGLSLAACTPAATNSTAPQAGKFLISYPDSDKKDVDHLIEISIAGNYCIQRNLTDEQSAADCLEKEQSLQDTILEEIALSYAKTHPMYIKTFVTWENTRNIECRGEGGNEYDDYSKIDPFKGETDGTFIQDVCMLEQTIDKEKELTA